MLDYKVEPEDRESQALEMGDPPGSRGICHDCISDIEWHCR